ncbi:hypothetical protein GMSM_19010 [Geomonas sp. Red276]
MKKATKLALAALVVAGLAGCGMGDRDSGVAGTVPPSPPTTIVAATGTLASDSWGYTGAAAVPLAAPSGNQVVLAGHTLLEDAGHAVVSGTTDTKVSYSADESNLSATARGTAPAGFLSYLTVEAGAVSSVLPALSVTISAGSAATGQAVIVCRYDATTGTWIQLASATVTATGDVSFSADRMATYALFKAS